MKITTLINDENGVLEPQDDILATAMIVIGFIIFVSLISKTYMSYDEHVSIIENYEEATIIAESIASNDLLQGARSDLISAEKLDTLSNGKDNGYEKELLFSKYSSNFDFTIEVSTEDGMHNWVINRDSAILSDRDLIAASIPVVIELGPTRAAPGTLTVKLCRSIWI